MEDIAEYAGRLYVYHRQHSELMRLLQLEALPFASDVPDEERAAASTTAARTPPSSPVRRPGS